MGLFCYDRFKNDGFLESYSIISVDIWSSMEQMNWFWEGRTQRAGSSKLDDASFNSLQEQNAITVTKLTRIHDTDAVWYQLINLDYYTR